MSRMKRIIGALCFILLLTGCAGKQAAASAAPTSSSAAMPQSAATPLPQQKPDLDLTQLSSVMVYSEVYNILAESQSYLGKTIRMKGIYYSAYDELTQKRYYYVIIQDATACCQQGMEFVLAEGGTYPPEQTEVEVTGVYERYEERGYDFYRIAADDLTVLT